MTPYVLEPETMYIMVVRQSVSILGFPDEWQYDQGDATYPRGYRVAQEGTDEPWDTYLDDDHIFAIFGTPPAPWPSPEPPIRNWAILDIQQTITATGYKIAVITNVPCHLYMMWTNKEPNKHKIVGLRRGDLALRETRYCFVDWNKNEQEEAGDTLTHTFYKEPWPVCETRWFTFKGDVDTLLTASAGPIFKKHRVQPPTTQDFYPDSRPGVTSFDGFSYAGRTYLTWAQLRARPADYMSDGGARLYVTVIGSSREDKWWEIDRSIALFDTSVIPIGSTILSATLKLYLSCPYCQLPGFAINIYSSDPLSNTEISIPDHLSLGATPFSTKLELTEVFNERWESFPFNAAGLAAIVPGGITKLGFREANFDAPNITPPWPGSGQTYVGIWSAETFPYHPATLTVTWKPS
ncbi:unnamed protein product [marine sediment metagenome]|uniref:Uncharacterized protein n=1 Tax=marine sediment metagenome TaxID=412755 RepID=X1LH57_9ZZZZ